MLDRFTSSLRIGLSRTGITLVRTKRYEQSRAEVLADIICGDDMLSAESLSARLSSLLDEARVSRLATTVILADDWARYFTVSPPPNAGRLQDCVAAARLRFQMVYDTPSSGWQLVGDWNGRRPFLTCAIPQWLPDVLNQVAAARRLTLIAVLPQFIAAWNRWQSRVSAGTWFGMVQAQQLTVGHGQKKRVSAVHMQHIPADSKESPRWLGEYISRTALLLGLPTPTELQLCGDVPPAWLGSDESLAVSQLEAPSRLQLDHSFSSGVALTMEGLDS